MNHIDIHCHPAMKPIGKSFKKKKNRFKNSTSTDDKFSIWYKSRPTWLDRFTNKILTLTKFTQSDFTSLSRGNVRIVCASIGPPEKGFVKTRLGSGLFALMLVSLVTCIPFKRLRYLARTKSYFRDIEEERDYYLSEEVMGKTEANTGKKYMLIGHKNDLIKSDKPEYESTIQVVFTIEGANIFDKGLEPKRNTPLRNTVIGNIERIKKWDYRPLWVSIGHLFYNELCGHVHGLPGITKLLINPKWKMGTGITDFGKEVIRKLLDLEKPPVAERDIILVDIKHMSVQSRSEYYVLRNDYNDDSPIIVSHGACNGIRNIGGDPVLDLNVDPTFKDYSGRMLNEPVNLYDDEIVRIAESAGLIGIMLDERRLANKQTLRETKKGIRRNKDIYPDINFPGQAQHRLREIVWWSRMVWENLYYVAKLLKEKGVCANDDECWNFMCIGSDFDGMVNPPDIFWTAAEFNDLREGLIFHADYYESQGLLFGTPPTSGSLAGLIIDKIMHDNAYNFIQSNLPN